MIYTREPFIFQPQQQISPSSINSNLLAAASTIQKYIDTRWHKTTVNGAGNELILTSITGQPFMIDRINVIGTYSTPPTITFGFVGGAFEQYTLPAKFSGELFSSAYFPGILMNGADGVQVYKIIVSGSSEMFVSAEIRSDRFRGTPPTVAPPIQYRDGDVFEAVEWDTQCLLLSSPAAAASIALDAPRTVFSHFTDLQNGSPQTDRVPGSGSTTVVRVTGYIEMDTAGAVGQNVVISIGFGSASPVVTRTVAGLLTATFTSGTIALSDFVRSPLNSADDLVITVSTNGASSVDHVWVEVSY